jgi:hypothetical protein
LDAGDRVQGSEKTELFVLVLDILVDKEGIGLGMNALDRILKGVEEASHGAWSITLEPGRQILLDNTVGSSEEGENVLDKVLLVLCERVPIALIFGKINFLGRPERGDGLFVQLVQLRLIRLDRKQRIAVSESCHDVYISWRK